MSNTFDKLSVLDSFIEEVNSYLPEIETNLERLTQSPGDMDALEETYRRTHTIGGSASMMDFPGLAHVAHGMEDILGDASDGLISLDEPALGLLRRSLGRLHQLVEGIRSGIDEESVIAEDDADYAQYRSLLDASSPASTDHSAEDKAAESTPVDQPLVAVPELPVATENEPLPSFPSLPLFEEVLASFRTPTLSPGEDLAWPEDPVAEASFDSENTFEGISSSESHHEYSSSVQREEGQHFSFEPPYESPHIPASALDALMASTRQNYTPTSEIVQDEEENYLSPPSSFASASLPVEEEIQPQPTFSFQATNASAADFWVPAEYADHVGHETEYTGNVFPASGSTAIVPSEIATPADAQDSGIEVVQQDVQAVAMQASGLKRLVIQLHEAVTLIENQRGEFKGFLNGSKDALDRMEDWAGQAMGLNLRNSPEHVRRYLPLSVMWVSNSKLKRVLEVLNAIANGITSTDEQVEQALQQLSTSLQSWSESFRGVQEHAPAHFEQNAAWSPWQMQVARDPESLRERVTFEREGDLSYLRAELEAQIREELRQEEEQREASAATRMRADLEWQIRNEVRQEFEERQRLQQRAAQTGAPEDLHELESRLRTEIEIQVRQEFLQQLTVANNDASALLQLPSSSVQSDARRQEILLSPAAAPIPSASVPPVQNRSQVPPVTPASASKSSTFANDFGEEAVEIFRMEAEEHLQTISMHVAALEKSPEDLELIQGIRRATHTLKGAAGMMGFRAIADLSHISEDLLDSIMEGKVSITSAVLSIILDTAETLDLLINRSDTSDTSDEVRVQALHKRYIELLGEKSSTQQLIYEDYLEDHEDTAPPAPSMAGVVADGHLTEVEPLRGNRQDLSVRVRLQRLDELVNLFGEILVNRSVLEERIQRLMRLVADVTVSSNRLRDVGQKLESRFEAATLPSGRSVQVMPGEGNTGLLSSSNLKNGMNGKGGETPAHFSDFDELELDRYTEFHQLARGLSEGISDMTTLSAEMDTIIRECESVFARENRLNTTFQDRLMKTRLVPLSNMVPRLYRAARAVALKQGKEIEFLREGEATEVDRTVFEEISGPLLHLVRNAVNHAIEMPELRQQKGKSPVGKVTLSAAYEGNQIVITVRDDGTGIDREGVRQTAIARGLIRPDHQLSENDLVSLIFHPGFSTAKVLSEESGRGVGLDVVRDSVTRLRGILSVESTAGQGTAFTMTFPTSVAIQGAMMVRVGNQQFAIPTVNVDSIGRLDNFKHAKVGLQPAVVVSNELYPLHMLAQYLSLPHAGVLDEKAQVILVNSGGRRVGLVVDEIKGKFDIVMKSLGPHLRHVHGIAGATVLGNGHVVLVLELSDLLATNISVIPTRPDALKIALPAGTSKQRLDITAGRISALPVQPTASAPVAAERGKHLLVVDDSPSVRRVVSNMLKQHGWEVQMARDGVEALEMISYETPAAVLLDIEMPRMDGYELISTVRAQEQYRTLPLIVLTSRAAAKHQQRAMTLGASAYVVKPYQDEELLNIINNLVYGTVAR